MRNACLAAIPIRSSPHVGETSLRENFSKSAHITRVVICKVPNPRARIAASLLTPWRVGVAAVRRWELALWTLNPAIAVQIRARSFAGLGCPFCVVGGCSPPVSCTHYTGRAPVCFNRRCLITPWASCCISTLESSDRGSNPRGVSY